MIRSRIARSRPLVAVTGGRDLTHRSTVWQALDAVRAELGQFTLIHGAADGAVSVAVRWAERRGVGHRAVWPDTGLVSAGPILVVAFSDDHVAVAARAAGIEVRHIESPRTAAGRK